MGHFFPKLIDVRSRIRLVSSAGILGIGFGIDYLHIFVHSFTIDSIIYRESVDWYVLEQKLYALPLMRCSSSSPSRALVQDLSWMID
jgi:hypothetical protein